VKGTTGVLQSILKHAPQVKRVVVTASVASVHEIIPETKTYTEEDWNEKACRDFEEQGKDSSLVVQYCASKTLAEKAAWDFAAKHKGQINFDLATIHPPFVRIFSHSIFSPKKMIVC
jgi:nucleoside-diphosphate-sugar epimerase